METSYTSNPNIDYGTLGSTPFLQYWNDLISVVSNMAGEQAMLWSGVFQQMLMGSTTPESPMQLYQRLMNSWLQNATALMTFPYAWCSRYTVHIPTVVFMVDQVSEYCGPVMVTTPINAANLSINSTPLLLVSKNQETRKGEDRLIIEPSYVGLQLVNNGNQLMVSLTNVSELTGSQKKPRGFFTGLVYAFEGSVRRPLALIQAYFDADSSRESPSSPPPPSTGP